MSAVDKAGSGSATERRRLARQSVIGRELISVEMPPDNFGLIIDLNENGAAIQAVAPMFSGERKTFRCTLPSDPEPLELTAEVVWSRQNKEAGLRFINPSQETRAKIRAALVLLAKDDLPADDQIDRDDFDALSWESKDASLDAGPAIPFDLQLESIARRAMDATTASGVAIAVLSDGYFVCRASVGYAPDVGVVLERNTGLSAEAIRTAAVVHCPDTGNDSRVDPDVCRELGMAAAVVVPVRRGGTVIALLESFWNTPFAYDDGGLSELRSTADCLLTLLDSNSGESLFDDACSPAMTSAPGVLPLRTSAEQEWAAASQASALLPHETAIAVDETAPYDVAAAADWQAEEELPAESSEDEIITAVESEEPSKVEPFTGPLVLPSSRREAITTILIGVAAFVLLTIPLTWYLLQKDAVPVPAPDTQSKVSNAPSQMPTQELDSVELPSLSTNPPREDGSASTRPVVVSTLTVRPKKSGDFQPLRLIHESRMPASAIRVTGASSRGGYSPRPAQVASSHPDVDSANEPQRRGTVVLDVTVTKDGTVEEVRVVSGDQLLAEAAKAAVANWRYQPATMDGSPVQGNARVTVRFQPSDNNQ